MKALYAKRLLKLAAFLRKVPEKHFDLNVVVRDCELLPNIAKDLKPVRNCGAAACAIGWIPAALPRLVRWDDYRGVVAGRLELSDKFDFYLAAEIFGLPPDWCEGPWGEYPMDYLFMPGNYPEGNKNRTAKKVAKRIEIFVACDGDINKAREAEVAFYKKQRRLKRKRRLAKAK